MKINEIISHLTVDYEMRIIIIKPVLGNEEEFTRTLNDLLTEVD